MENFYESIIQDFNKKIVRLAQNNELFNNLSFLCINEQVFLRLNEYDENTIYFVFRFGTAEKITEQFVQAVSISCFGKPNTISITQQLILDYINENTNHWDTDNNWLTIFTTPSVVQNYVEIGVDYRSVFTFGATYLYSPNVDDVESVVFNYAAQSYEIPFLSFGWNFNEQLDTQAFFGTKSIGSSRSVQGILAFNFTMYMTNNILWQRVRTVAYSESGEEIDGNYNFTIKFKSGKSITKNYHLVNCSFAKQIASLAVVQYTFTF